MDSICMYMVRPLSWSFVIGFLLNWMYDLAFEMVKSCGKVKRDLAY